MNSILICPVVLLAIFAGSVLSQNRIFGGKPIEIEEAPYTISLEYLGLHVCGGALISQRFVLSAKQCTEGRTMRDLRVRVGSTKRNFGGVIIDIINIHEYQKETSTYFHEYDFVILHLEKVSKFPTRADVINLPSSSDESNDGELAVVTGWGETQNSTESTEYLRAAEVPIVNDHECDMDWGSNTITSSMICAGNTQGGNIKNPFLTFFNVLSFQVQTSALVTVVVL